MGARPNPRVEGVPTGNKLPIKVEELQSFTRESRKVLSATQRAALREEVTQMRELGDIIPGTGGLRKMRWQLDNGKGKSGGARVLYYYGGDDVPIYLVAFYEKSKKANLTAAERKAAKKIVQALKSANRRLPQLRVVS